MENKQKCRMETMFKSALDKVTDCILAVSLEGNLLYVNKQFIAIHGLDKDWHKYTVFDLPVSFNTPEQFAKKVDFPAPLAPITPYILPLVNLRFTSLYNTRLPN